jgi:error-prone DNA polymerase
MPGRTVIEWNKDDLDELGILKVDCLSLGMLSAIHRCFDLVERHHGRRCTMANIPPDDPGVYAMIQQADTMGVFQIESRAQMSMLPRLRPKCFYDLVIEVAIVRPGPIQGDMVHPYLRRRNGEEQVEYPNDAVREVLHKTLGVPLFQEQAMRLAVVAAGFTPGEADQLRRAMGAWRRPGVIDRFRRKLIDGMLREGFTREYADSVFNQLRGFGDYGFPESHAASFALLVYVSAWLKHHYPAAFTAALLNSQPMGFYAPSQLVRDARAHGVEVCPVDVNHSDWDCTLNGGDTVALRLGFCMLDGLRRDHADRIVAARRDGAFRSMDDFARRTRLSRASLGHLSKAGVFESLRLDRREALWHALDQDDTPLPLFDGGHQAPPATPAALPRLTDAQQVLADYRAQGLSLRAHPMQFLREGLAADGILAAEQLATWPRGERIRVAGLVLVRQRPSTARGITFVTLEDETAQANLIIRPGVWRRFRQVAIGATVMLVAGRLQRERGVIHVLVERIEDLSDRMAELASQSRNFC